MRTVAIINQKGGCGKTTTAINLGAMLARSGLRVLLVDMDPQSHCAAGLGVPESRIELDIGDAMLNVGHKPLDTARLLWRVARQMDLAPSRMRLAGLEAAAGGLSEQADRERRLAAVLREVGREYDVACIDCPPSIGLLTYNALAASDAVLVPVETSFFSLQGATKQVNTVRSLSRRLGVQLPAWIVATIHDEQNAVAADLLAELQRRFKERVSPVVIRRDPKLREAASFGQPIGDYAPECEGAHDYQRLAAWVRDKVLALGEQMPAALMEEHEEDTTPGVYATTLSDSPATRPSTTCMQSDQGGGTELKPLSRAEDVARRAQEFLRRAAIGRSQGDGSASASTHATQGPARPGLPDSNTKTCGDIGTASTAAVNEAERANAVMGADPRSMTGVGATPLVIVSPTSSPVSISHETALAATALFGVRETHQGVLFVQPISCGRRVCIAGTFNGWSPTSHEMRANHEVGVFELCVRLPAGRTRYRLVIDGKWAADPFNRVTEPNPYGEPDSVVDVRGIWNEPSLKVQESAI